MFELAIARKYLLPKRRQLSVSIISLLSLSVIALVVWLILLFIAVCNGLEKSWVGKLVAVTAPLRITPTDDYLSSYYYLVDTVASQSDYRPKTIGEKASSSSNDPYDPDNDESLPVNFPPPLLDEEGQLKDLVKGLYAVLHQLQSSFSFTIGDYEAALATLKLQLFRPSSLDPSISAESSLNHPLIIGSIDPHNRGLSSALLPPDTKDLENILFRMGGVKGALPRPLVDAIEVKEIKVPLGGHKLDPLLFKGKEIRALTILSDEHIRALAIMPENQLHEFALHLPKEVKGEELLLTIDETSLTARKLNGDEEPIATDLSLFIPGGIALPVVSFLDEAYVQLNDLRFPLSAIEGASISRFELIGPSPLPWLGEKGNLSLPSTESSGEAILLPRPFKEGGVAIGDRGVLSYLSPSMASMTEQTLPIYVAGFFDQGIIPIGGKLAFLDQPFVRTIHDAMGFSDPKKANGIHLHFDSFQMAPLLKQKIENALAAEGLGSFWKVESYEEYEFAREIIQQMRSDKNLFLIIATVIIIVACSNIVSMLILLVNDKKKEIGILRSMGASKKSIALIFGSCGVFLGALGSLIGILAAIFTLQHLDYLIALLDFIQGGKMFNPLFYGESLPQEWSAQGFLFVLIATTILSLIAALVPSIKASRIDPSTVLKAE